MTTATKTIYCTYCLTVIKPKQGRKSVKDKHNGRSSWYHEFYDDCADGLRMGMVAIDD